MIRIKIRYDNYGDEQRSVLRFDPSIELEMLLRKAIDKLVLHSIDGSVDYLSDIFELRLGGDHVIEAANEIEHGDELVLTRIEDEDEDKPTVPVKQEQGTSKVKRENESEGDSKPPGKSSSNYNDPNDNTKRRSTHVINRVKKENIDHEDVISISSDESEHLLDAEDEADLFSSDGESDWKNGVAVGRGSKRRKRNPKKPSESPLEVTMNEKDVPSAPGKPDNRSEDKNSDTEEFEQTSLLVENKDRKKSEDDVKHRIIKLLNTGFHDQSNEHEAKNAMKLAQRLMRKHNLSQALLLKEREAKNSQSDKEDEVLKGGLVSVSIRNRKTRKPSLLARWISRLAGCAINPNFGVEAYYSTRRGVYCDVVFFGIYSNAQLAAYAFKVATERIAQMSADYRPEKSSRNISTKSSRLSYALGIVEGISKDVKMNLQMEKEKRKRKLDRARLAGSRGEAYEESDNDDDDGIDNEGTGTSIAEDVKSSGETYCKSKILPDQVSSGEAKPDSQPRTFSGTDLRNRVEELEREEKAALVLVNHNERIAKEVLKEHDLKLKKTRKRKSIDFDPQSYRQGIEDSKEIDLNQRAIRNGVKVKVEKM